MALGVGPITLVNKDANSAALSCAAGAGGVGPYTYQWYMSTTQGFTPGGGNILTGETALLLSKTGLLPQTTYYFVVRVTDVGDGNATEDSAEFTLTTSSLLPGPNQFKQTTYIGILDQRLNFNSIPCRVSSSESADLVPGQPVKLEDTAGGVPVVTAVDAEDDAVYGFVNYNIKNDGFGADENLEVSIKGNVMFLQATEAIARGAEVQLDIATVGGVKTAQDTGDTIVGWAFDKAAAGQILRVYIETPSFKVV